MWNEFFERWPVTVRGRTRPHVFEGSDLPNSAVDTLIFVCVNNYFHFINVKLFRTIVLRFACESKKILTS